MVIAELRYLGNFIMIFFAIIVLVVASMAIGSAAQLDAMATTVVFVVLGGSVCVGAVAFFAWRSFRAAAGGVALSSTRQARYAPLLIDFVLLAWFTYRLVDMFITLHAGEPVSRDSVIFNCWFFVLWLLYTVRDVRDKLRADSSSPLRGFSARKLNALTAAYALPTVSERRRALRPLRNRGFARLALFPAMFVLFFLFEPHYGVGVAILAAFAIVLTIFVILHKALDL